MKNFSILLLALCLFTSCVDQQGSQKENYNKTDSFVKKFLESHPKASQNDIYLHEANDEFEKQINEFFKDSSGITYLPLTSISVGVFRNKFIVHFENANLDNNEISSNSHLDVFAVTDETTAKSIIQGSQYRILKYTNCEVMPFIFKDNYTNDKIYTDYTKLEITPYERNYCYGNFVLNTVSIVNWN
jgi:hypothetical protein